LLTEKSEAENIDSFGSEELDKLVHKLRTTSEPRKRYEYLLWLGKSLPALPQESFNESIKVKGCISKVYVLGNLSKGKMSWNGYSDALITKGILAFLIKGLSNLSPEEVLNVNPKFIEATGLSKTLTQSRVNGFLNIFIKMKEQAHLLL